MSILKLGIHEDWDHEGWPTTAFVTPESIEQYHEEIELGDEVFSVGLFWPHKGKTRNIPLVRIGNIAALRDERVETKQDLFSDVYLMEARSVGGLSGAPVFIDIVRARLTGREITTSGNLFVGPFRFRLIGLLSGHFTGVDEELVSTGISTKELEKLNMGIAYVTPADKLFEGLKQFKGGEEEESRHYRETGSLSIEVGDTTPRDNVSSQLATSETKGKKN